VRAKICQFHSYQTFLQMAKSYCLLTGCNSSCKCSLLYEQAVDLVCNVTVKFVGVGRMCWGWFKLKGCVGEVVVVPASRMRRQKGNTVSNETTKYGYWALMA
jgi:hypothetical protein